MKNKLSLTQALLAATMLLSVPAFADDEDMTPAAAPSEASEPSPFANATAPAPVNNYGAAPIVSGGIGEEMDYLKSIQDQYNLKLLITETNGIFLSDVDVHIEDKQGNTVADTVTEGPVLLAKLPPGNYKITAKRQDDETKELKVSVTAGKLHAYQVAFHNTDDRESGDAKTTPLK